MTAQASLGTADEVTTSLPVSEPQPQAPTVGIAVETQAAPDTVAIVSEILAQSPVPDEARDAADHKALIEFYATPLRRALWIEGGKLSANGVALAKELANADAYGLDAKAFRVAALGDGSGSVANTAEAELSLSRAALLYARHARGGRIPDPAEMLSTNLDRRPQWIEPKDVLDGLATATGASAYLVSLHPKQPQFEKLRQLYAEELRQTNGTLSPTAKRLRANMEMWRWMWLDMGDLYVLNNIPEFMQRVYKNGEVIRSEKIVAGMLDKQTAVFSRPLKYVVLRPKWRVPESIKVNELWPSLIRGGGYMRQYGLQLETKDGKPLDYRAFDWRKEDIRNFEVTQPPGPRSVLGNVKFSFPSQHTIFMHDTPDKWMFRDAKRTHSHGCLRVWKPMELAEIILSEDKGWDKAKVAEVSRSGPLNNEIEITKEIPVHLTYFTAWVGDDGRVQFFNDVYGHEKRVTLALDGQWSKINKGRDHLAPVEVSFDPEAVAARAPPQASRAGYAQRRSIRKDASYADIFSEALGLGQ